MTGFFFLFLLLADIIGMGTPAFTQSFIKVSLTLDHELLDIPEKSTADDLWKADYSAVIKQGLREMFPDVEGRKQKKQLYRLISIGAQYQLRDYILENPELVGESIELWLMAHSEADSYLKGQVNLDDPEADRRLKDNQVVWLDQLRDQGLTEKRFNTTFFTAGDSREPELAGIKAALIGSFFTLLVTFLLSFPVGVFAAVYLEEFAPRNRLTLSLIHISEPTRLGMLSRMPSSA